MIKILKSGNWALGGTEVVEVVEGAEQTFGPVEDCQLVADGWAEWIKAEAPKAEAEAEPKASRKKAE